MRKVHVKILVHLEHLKNIFFAERLLLMYGQVNQGDLIATSFTILTRVLVFWTHRERFSHPSIRRNFEWLVSEDPSFGICSSGGCKPRLTEAI